ncbi:arginine--tRNA ligase [Dactylosporangium sp. CA-152071]|uniref:arginine--tRNA ligase n=1 Tax=Dactylosporangium sp. CA-152071 TaxID=3239933 RepID=UPI003D940F23
MVVPSFAALLAARITAALPSVPAGFDPQVRLSEHADLQADGVLALARPLRRPPRQLAAEVAAEVATGLPGGIVADVRVAGPGFLNVTLTGEALLGRVAERLADPRLGVGLPETGVRTVLDYSHPNVAREMHVGHLRSTIIGDALARVLTHLGGTVVRQNHIGDWGTQYGMLIQYLAEHPADTAALTQRYKAAYALFQADPAFAARSRARVVALQGGDPGSLAVWHAMVEESTRYFSDVYERLGVLLTAADIAGESSYNPMLAGVAGDLAAAGVARVSDGALCVFADGADAPLIVRKSDGGFGYPATDLAAVRHRVTTLRADRIVYVVDARQAPHFRMVFDTARRAGWLPPEVEAVHAAFGVVLGADGRPFKTRAGDTAPLVGLLGEAVERATAVVAAKNPSLPAQELAERGREVGIGAVKYADLSTSRTRDYLYDPDRMMALTGNTSVYLQYAHARLRSVLAKAGSAVPPVRADAPLEDVERALILRLDGFGDVVAGVAAGCEPHRLCTYLFELAQAVTAFYERCPVLKSPEPLRGNRIALCALTASTLATGLGLLGIAAPPQL